MARLFLAIDLPGPEKEKLALQLTDLKKLYPQFSWVDPGNYHITIFYFGDTYDQKKINTKLSHIVYRFSKLYFYSTKIGLFISKKITIYLDFRREKTLEELVCAVRENFITDARLLSEKKYVPHLTLARYKIPSKQQYLALKKRLEKTEIDIEFTVGKVILFESVLEGKKPLYKKIAQWKLG